MTSNAACSRALRGLRTATTSRHSIFGLSERRQSFFLKPLGGFAQAERFCAGFGGRSAKCRKVATIGNTTVAGRVATDRGRLAPPPFRGETRTRDDLAARKERRATCDWVEAGSSRVSQQTDPAITALKGWTQSRDPLPAPASVNVPRAAGDGTADVSGLFGRVCGGVAVFGRGSPGWSLAAREGASCGQAGEAGFVCCP